MDASITRLPVELQEKILFNLRGPHLYTASKVCKLWLELCGRVVNRRYETIIPKECVVEIEKNSRWREAEVYVKSLHYHILQEHFHKNMLGHSTDCVAQIISYSDKCFETYGNFLFIGTQDSKIIVYDVLNETTVQEGNKKARLPVVEICLDSGAVVQVQTVYRENVLIVLTTNDIQFWSLPNKKGNAFSYKMSRLLLKLDNYVGPIECYRNVSVCGNIVTMITNPYEISVFQLKKENSDVVSLTYLTQYVTVNSIFQCSIWNNEVSILLRTGEVVHWNLLTEESSITDKYQEICYQNPCWVLRGRVFCSTIISSQLLGYWHMDRGASYWLIGSPGCEMFRCRDLGTMFSADTGIEDVLCVTLKQRLLVCGTKEGKILIYHLSSNFFNTKKLDEENEYCCYNPNQHLSTEFDRVPDLTIRTKQRPVREVSVEFMEDKILIYIWPYVTAGGPGAIGFVECITLSEGDWVTKEEKESIR